MEYGPVYDLMLTYMVGGGNNECSTFNNVAENDKILIKIYQNEGN